MAAARFATGMRNEALRLGASSAGVETVISAA
jgi:hypothetical protein